MNEKYNNLDIENYNSKDELHGYQERYNNNKLMIRINMYNGNLNGYYENHIIKRTTYNIR